MKVKYVLIPLILLITLILYAPPSFASMATFYLNEGMSYQDEGTLTYDDTSKLKNLDGNWGPTTTGTVSNNYYATGTSTAWFDAISANFDLSSIGHSNLYSVTLMAYINKGTYSDSTWHHYDVYQGAFNAANQDARPSSAVPSPYSFDSNGWISYDIPLAWVTSDDFDVSLRLWNASVDQVKLVAGVVPEPMSMSLLGMGLLGALGAAGFRRKR